jgi:hypothetical protein
VKKASEILVVANRTALSSDLERAMRARRARGPARFTLLVPAGEGAGSDWIASHMAASLREEGLDIEAVVGDRDPLRAVLDVWRAGRFDEIIVSTLPAGASRWMVADLPREIGLRTGVPVSHVEAGARAGRGTRRREALGARS